MSLFEIEPITVPLMPTEYFGEGRKPCGYTKTSPRAWTDKEIEWITSLKQQGFSIDDIAKSVDRSPVSISIKFKRMRKTDDTYNAEHLEDKYQSNQAFVDMVRPDSILDLYCGIKSWYKNNLPSETRIVTNDKDSSIEADHHEDAEYLVHKFLYERKSFDVIDIDPFGSGFECFDCAIKMAKKGLIVTFGEYGHKRFKRLDFVSTHYGIKTIEDFTLSRMVDVVQRIGERNKKKLTPIITKQWNRICRVYFTIETIKVTSQWENK